MAYTGSATVSNPTSGSAGQSSDRQILSPQAWADLFASSNTGAGVALGTRSVKGLVIDGTGNQVVAANGTLSVSGASTLTGAVTMSSTLAVTGAATIGGKLTLNSGTPTVTALAGAGVSPTISSSGKDQAFTVTLGMDHGGGTGDCLQVTFGSAFAAAPKGVILVPANDKASEIANTFYADAASVATTGFKIRCSTAPADATTYKFNCLVF